MRQVPQRVPYAILGAGRLARHFCRYFDLLGIAYLQWSRQQDPHYQQLVQIIAAADRVLILLTDSAIEIFIQENPILKNKLLIHCSGQLVSQLACGAHPLMTFAADLYSVESYQQIPFVIEQEGPTFNELFPGLNNPHFAIPQSAKAFYHALCVMSGNFTCLLWQKFFQELETKLQMPKEVAYPYMQQIFANLQQNSSVALTGPLARGDQTTITKNLNSLESDPFQKIYQAFVEVYQSIGK